MNRLGKLLGVLACCATLAGAAPALAAGRISVELNKLETVGAGCRVYMVFANGTAGAISSYKPDLVLFGKDGVIAERLVVEGGPLPAGKTRVKLFDVQGLACAAVGQVLLNDLRACEGAGTDAAACLEATDTSSRAGVEFIK